MNASSVLRTVLIATGVLTVVLAVVGGGIGFAVAGTDGLFSALVGTAVAILFAVISVASLMAAMKLTAVGFLATIMGTWLLKMALFVVSLLALRQADFVQPLVLFLSLVVAIVGTVLIDVVVVYRSRLGHVSDVTLPASPDASGKAPNS